MTWGRKTGGRNIQKGQVLNPHGGRLHNPLYKALKKMSQAELSAILNTVMSCNLEELQKMASDKDAPIPVVWLAKTVEQGIKKGDVDAFDKLMNRLVGPVKHSVALSNDGDDPFRIEDKSAAELKTMLAGFVARAQVTLKK